LEWACPTVQLRLEEVDRLLSIVEAQRGPRTAVACVLTRPPESVLLYAPARDSREESAPAFVLFDSHARPDHAGAAFVLLASGAALLAYLRATGFGQALQASLVDSANKNSTDGFLQLQLEHYALLDACVLRLSDVGAKQPIEAARFSRRSDRLP
jgi:hypothetical protein